MPGEDENEQRSTPVPSWLRSLEPNIHVSRRAYDVVREVLNYPDSELRHGRVLSVGEGLSDFSRKLHDLLGVDVIAIDPIYELGSVLFTMTKEEIKELFKKKYGKRLQFNPIMDEAGFRIARLNQSEKIEALSPDPKRIVAASAYELPFGDKAFDKVILYRVIQHLDPAIAMPELVRVVKENGEIRMGGINLHAWLRQKELFSGQIETSKWGDEFRPYGKFLLSLMTFISSNPALSAYVIVDDLDFRNGDRGEDLVKPRSIVIRKDNELPKIAGQKTGIWKIDPTPIVTPYKMPVAMQFCSLGEDFLTYYSIEPVK